MTAICQPLIAVEAVVAVVLLVGVWHKPPANDMEIGLSEILYILISIKPNKNIYGKCHIILGGHQSLSLSL